MAIADGAWKRVARANAASGRPTSCATSPMVAAFGNRITRRKSATVNDSPRPIITARSTHGTTSALMNAACALTAASTPMLLPSGEPSERSELILQRKLHDPRFAGGQDPTEVRVVQVGRRVSPAEPVERVERFHPRLDAMGREEAEGPHEREIQRLGPRADERVAPGVAERSERGLRERLRVEPAVERLVAVAVALHQVAPLDAGRARQRPIDAGRDGEPASRRRPED